MEVNQYQQGNIQQSPSIMHSFVNKTHKNSSKLLIIVAIAIIAGIGAGFMLSHIKQGTSQMSSSGSASVAKGTIIGSNDTSTFKDTATGVMQKGGIDGEGQFHLVRPGGESQNVYLTSSIVDLSQFVGKKVKVNGQTQTAKKAGWLMDVGRVEVLE